MKKDLISIVMPVFRPNISYFKVALDSILNQIYDNIELIIVEDEPDDRCKQLLDNLENNNVLYIGNKERQGIAKCLNIGIQNSKGKYIARMDADDFSLPDRLLKQYEYMEKHPEVGVCGAWSLNVLNGKVIYKDNLSKSRRSVKNIFSNEGLLHPTVMFRKDFLKDNGLSYDESYKMAEDYDLWVRCNSKGSLYTIPDVLLITRIHEGQVSVSAHEKEKYYINKIKLSLLSCFNSISNEEKESFVTSFSCNDEMLTIIKRMRKENDKREYFNRYFFSGELGLKWIQGPDNYGFLKKILSCPIPIMIWVSYLGYASIARVYYQLRTNLFKSSSRYKFILRNYKI